MDQRSSVRDQAAEEPSLLRRLHALLKALSPMLAAAGAIAVVGGGSLFLWAQDLRPFARPVFLVGLGLLLAAGLASINTVVATIAGRRGRYSANTVAMVALFLALVALVNFILFQREVRYDTTATRQFTLASQTVQVLEDLDEPIRATAFFVPTDRTQEALRRQSDDLLYEFGRRSDQFTYRFVDPEREPSIAKQYGVTLFSTIVFEATVTEKRHMVSTPPVTEQDFTSALLVVTGEEQKVVYFLTGHGERSITDVTADRGFGFAARGAISDNYRIELLNLQQTGGFPDDAAMVVIAAPTRDLLTRGINEWELLEEYLGQGGNALLLVDTDTPRAWRQVLARWGVAVVPGRPLDPQEEEEQDLLEQALALVYPSPGTVVDPGSSVTGDPRTPILQSPQHLRDEEVAPTQYPRENPASITRELDVTFYPAAVALAPSILGEEMPETLRVTPLAVTSLVSWLTPDAEDNSFDPERDALGPHALAMAVEALAPLGEEATPGAQEEREGITKLVVFGDVDFATNQYFYAFSNSDFFLNAINWLAEDYQLISIRPKTAVFRELITTSQEFDFIRYSSLFLVPAAVLFLGAIVWWRRR